MCFNVDPVVQTCYLHSRDVLNIFPLGTHSSEPKSRLLWLSKYTRRAKYGSWRRIALASLLIFSKSLMTFRGHVWDAVQDNV